MRRGAAGGHQRQQMWCRLAGWQGSATNTATACAQPFSFPATLLLLLLPPPNLSFPCHPAVVPHLTVASRVAMKKLPYWGWVAPTDRNRRWPGFPARIVLHPRVHDRIQGPVGTHRSALFPGDHWGNHPQRCCAYRRPTSIWQGPPRSPRLAAGNPWATPLTHTPAVCTPPTCLL